MDSLSHCRSHVHQETSDLDQQSGAQQYIGGGGETLLEKKQRQLRDKEGALRKALEKLKGKRALLRKGRERKHFPHVAVVGYTNAGNTMTTCTTFNELNRQCDQIANMGIISNYPLRYTHFHGFLV